MDIPVIVTTDAEEANLVKRNFRTTRAVSILYSDHCVYQ